MKRYLSCILTIVLVAPFAFADEGDWPQWRGPNRDGHASAEGLMLSWPEGGPELAWSTSLGGTGYSSVSVVGNQIFTMVDDGAGCQVVCLDLSNGKEIWRRKISRSGGDSDYNTQWGNGPRSTPTVDGNQVFALSDVGILAALDKETGEIQWTSSFMSDHGGKIPTWGYSESPLVDNDRVVVTPGGANFMIALDRKTGDLVWSSKGAATGAQYVSVMRGKTGGTSFYVSAGKPGLFAFSAKTGDLVFSDTATGNRIAVIPTPILKDDHLYHTSAYGAGNTLLKLSKSGAKITTAPVYSYASKSMENHHGGVVLVDGVIYGFSKTNRGVWMAQDFETGDVLWQKSIKPNRSGSISYADGRLYCYNDKDGTVHLVEPSRQDWIPRGILTIPQETEIPRNKGAIWAHPVIAAGKLFIRDQDQLFAFNVAK